jgi:hypothetical protein
MYVGLENRMMRNHNISLAGGLIGVSEVWGGIIGFFISVTMKSKKKSCRLYEKVSSQRCVKWQSDFRNSWKSKWLNIKCKFSDISFFLIHSDYKLCYLEIWHKGLLIFTLFGFIIVCTPAMAACCLVMYIRAATAYPSGASETEFTPSF